MLIKSYEFFCHQLFIALDIFTGGTRHVRKSITLLFEEVMNKDLFLSRASETKTYYDMCFNENGKVKAEIKEQELRNILLQYLNKNMQGEVAVEFCTSYVNDEESVDIYVNDGKQRAIIEVKFSLPEKYYEGATNYSLSQRVGDGIKQLDKYALHLAKDARLVDYGYVFVFYMSDLKTETICNRIDKKVAEVMQESSEELHSIFSGVETSDMKMWGTRACT